MQEKKVRVLSYGDNAKMSTGYGCIWDNLLRRFVKAKPDWEFMHCGWQNTDRPHKAEAGYIRLPRANLDFGFDTVLNYLMKYKPNILLTMADLGKQSGWIKGVNEARKRGWRGKWIMYSPIDCHQWAIHWDGILQISDINLAMSNFGVEMFEKHNISNVKVIPVGVDTKTYIQKSNREERRIKYSINNKFVCGFVGRNQTRKMIPYMIRGFANFAKGKDDVILLLHTDAAPPGGEGRGNVIDGMVYKFGKETDQSLFDAKKIMLTESNLGIVARQGISPEHMNDVYNLMDLYLYPTGGEGFGMPALESQSAGVPILMSNNTTGPELAGSTGELIDMLKDKYERIVGIIGTNGVENLIPDDKHVAILLEKYYADWKAGGKLLKEMSEKSRKLALAYDWDVIVKRWIKLFEENII